MPVYSGNKDYLSIDGVDLSAYWREATIAASIDMQENTSGGSAYKTRFATVKDYTLNFTVVYDSEQAATLLSLLAPGEHLVTYGPEGNAAGKPKHQQHFIFPQIETGGNADKSSMRVFSVQAQGAKAPIFDMFNGGIF